MSSVRLLVLLVVGLSPARGADQKQAVYCVRFSPDGTRLVSGGANRKAQVWDLETAREIASFEHGGWIQTVDFSPDGLYVPSGVRDLTMPVWDVGGSKLHKEFNHQGWVVCGLFLPDKKTALSAGPLARRGKTEGGPAKSRTNGAGRVAVLCPWVCGEPQDEVGGMDNDVGWTDSWRGPCLRGEAAKEQ